MTITTLSKPAIMVVAATAIASALGGYVWHMQDRPKVLEIYVFALKSGNSLFIRTPNDQRILIDGGGNSEVIRHLTGLIPFYSRRINTIIVTNTEGNSIAGLVDVIDRYIVDQVYVPQFTLKNLNLASSTDKIYDTFLETVLEKNIEIAEIMAGNELAFSSSSTPSNFDSDSKVNAKILFPASPELFEYSKASAPEVLMNISFGSNSVLFIGNASKKIQKFLASPSSIDPKTMSTSAYSNAPKVGRADVLIVSHSALPANMSEEFMDVARPKFLVYSKIVTSASKRATTNKKPTADPLATILNENRFNLKGGGTVKIVSNGKEITVENKWY